MSKPTTRTVVKEPLRDSSLWDHVIPRQDDIIIATCYKAGTTLTQQIVNILLHPEQQFTTMRAVSPWVESNLHAPSAAKIEALASPRFLKTHLHPQALPWHEQWKYIYLGRDGRDVGLSLYNHNRVMAEEWAAQGIVGKVDHGAADFSEFWDQWVENGQPRWDFWNNVQYWWEVRDEPNVLLLHYNELLQDKPRAAARIAEFLDCEWNEQVCERVIEQSSIEYMRNMELSGQLGFAAKNKTKTGLINKGSNGRWQNLLSAEQLQRYHTIVEQRLNRDCAAWLHQDTAY